MISEATSIQLSGANFSTPTQLPVFRTQGNTPGKFVKASLLYGRNGTGKSTIARAFRKLGGEDVPVIMSAELLDDDEAPITLSSDDQRCIFVFDEDFVEEKVKLREEDLETIVMLGEAGNIEERLKEATTALNAAKKAVGGLEDTMEGYSDEKSPKSPAYYRSRLTSVLKGDDAWAGRDKEIREGRQNTSVKSDTYKEFVNLKPSKPKDQLLVEFREGMDRLRAARTGSARIDEGVPELPTISECNDEETTSLLRKTIQSPELSERELFLLELVENGQGDKVSAIAEDFGRDEVTRCPHCLQKVTEEYKSDLVQSVSKVLSKTVEEHKESLRQCLIGTIEQDRLDLSAFRDLEGYGTCDTLLKALDTAIWEHNDLINKKIGNPYEPVIEAPQPIGPLVTQVRTSLASLEDERVHFNSKVTKAPSTSTEMA